MTIDADALRKYDKDATCIKCGGTEITTYYCRDCYRGYRHHKGERMHRHCKTCHYEWDELPLTAALQALGGTE